MNNLEETFRYDNLNRLTEIRLGGVFTVSNQPLEMFNMRFNKTINRIGRLPYDLERNGAAMQIANYKMNYNVLVDAANSSIYVNANSYNTPIMDGTVIPCAKATLLFNNQIIDSKPLVYMGKQ